jgi:hypothetical protein
MPGESKKIIWPFEVVLIPRICLRVVCGLFETIETLTSKIEFKNVDLPTLVLPISAT